jgi:hypothetical protein
MGFRHSPKGYILFFLRGGGGIEKKVDAGGSGGQQGSHRVGNCHSCVAEITDNNFEEHVIETAVDQVGQNLHSINLNTPKLLIYSPGHQGRGGGTPQGVP